MKISALVLTKNEEKMIRDCLEQLSFADEIILLDQKSQDNTVKIAKKYTQHILTSSSEDFAENRNILAKCAKGKWLLYLDADERIGKEFIQEAKEEIKNNKYSAYLVPRNNFVLGKKMNHGGWWPDYVPKLIRKDKFKGWTGQVHESVKVDGDIGHFNSAITHLTARDLNYMLLKSIKWAKIEAQLNSASNAPTVTIFKIIKASLKEFVRRYVIKRGFLDGTIGLVQAIYQSLHQAIVLTYLWEIQNNK